jgi:hypothetical protein
VRIPEYWAECRLQLQRDQRQISVRRFGWSDVSHVDAERHAEQRAQEALQKIASGQKLPRRERKTGYNGADDIPIREEVLERARDFLITRNSYGALCLNSPNVFFADIDFVGAKFTRAQFWLSLVFAAVGSAALIAAASNVVLAAMAFIPLVGLCLLLVYFAQNLLMALRGGSQRVAYRRIESFSHKHPDWHLRVYRTPRGYRVMAMHETLEPRSAAVADAFAQLDVDPTYARMCRSQNCFRARLTAKPWRTSMEQRISRAIWPIEDPVKLQTRQAWVKQYERVAEQYAACQFEVALGATRRSTQEAEEVRRYHDHTSKALSNLPLA